MKEKRLLTLTMDSKKSYQDMIQLAEDTGVYKACGNLDNMWIILIFDNDEHLKDWQLYHFGEEFLCLTNEK